MLIDKKKFCNLMEIYEEAEDEMRVLDNILKTISPDFGGFYPEKFIMLINKLLQTVCSDNEEDSMLEYYLYERNWGQEEGDCVWDKDGNAIPLKTHEDLWNYFNGITKE